MSARIDELDLSTLPDYAFGANSPSWWAVVGFMLIEGAGFVLAIGAYLYLMPFEEHWPPAPFAPPSWWHGLPLLAVMVFSEIINVWTQRAAYAQDARRVRIGLGLLCSVGVLALALRGVEFGGLNVHWTANAYGSVVWAIVVLHTFHLLTDVYDSFVLWGIALRGHVTGRKHADVADNAMYWHFIVWSWVLLFALLYVVPRWR